MVDQRGQLMIIPDTFILDSNFSDILKYNKFLPKYFIDAVKILNI